VTARGIGATTDFDWHWLRFGQLSGDDVYDLLALRSEIFVVEQHCVFADADGFDRASWHLLGRIHDEDGRAPLGAYLRCVDPGLKYVEPSIGRVVVSARLRGAGCGRTLMNEGIARSRRAWPGAPIVIGAQQRLEAFYASLGFATEGMPYDEDGIQHVQMRLAAAP
jgi:ElaA protein